MKTQTFPTPERIKEVIEKVETRISVRRMNMNKNFAVKEGLTDSLRILNDRLTNPENTYFQAETTDEWQELGKIYREQLNGIEKLETVAGRSIAILCVDWLNGKEQAIKFVDVKIKQR